MSYFIQCNIDTHPCPPGNQITISEPTVQDFTSIGINAGDMSLAIGFGISVVFFIAKIGIVVGIIKQLINRI